MSTMQSLQLQLHFSIFPSFYCIRTHASGKCLLYKGVNASTPASTIYIRGSMHQHHDRKEQLYIYQTWQMPSIVPKYMGQCIKTVITNNNCTYYQHRECIVMLSKKDDKCSTSKKNYCSDSIQTDSWGGIRKIYS
jgi:hypothetical protein